MPAFWSSPGTNTPAVAKDRFSDHIRRIYKVLETHLSGKHSGIAREYLAGNGKGRYSVADIGAWAHLKAHSSLGVSDEEMVTKFPSLFAWVDRIGDRSAVVKGIDPTKYDSEVNRDGVVAADRV